LAAEIMTNPGVLEEDTVLFMAGNDAGAKTWVMDTVLKKWFGWKNVMDLGALSSARGMEMYLPLWATIYGLVKTPDFNIKLVMGKKSKASSAGRKAVKERSLVGTGHNNKRRQ